MKSCSVVDLFCGVGEHILVMLSPLALEKLLVSALITLNLLKVGKRKEVAKNGFGNYN